LFCALCVSFDWHCTYNSKRDRDWMWSEEGDPTDGQQSCLSTLLKIESLCMLGCCIFVN